MNIQFFCDNFCKQFWMFHSQRRQFAQNDFKFYFVKNDDFLTNRLRIVIICNLRSKTSIFLLIKCASFWMIFYDWRCRFLHEKSAHYYISLIACKNVDLLTIQIKSSKNRCRIKSNSIRKIDYSSQNAKLISIFDLHSNFEFKFWIQISIQRLI